MALLDGFRSFCLADSGIAALIVDRLGPGPNTQQPPTYPYTDYFLMPSGTSEYTFDLRATRKSRIQCDHIGSMSQCDALASAFQAALEGYIGLFPDASQTRVLFIEIEDGPTSFTGVIDQTVGPIQKYSQDFIVQYSS